MQKSGQRPFNNEKDAVRKKQQLIGENQNKNLL